MLYHYTAWYPFLAGSKLPISAPYGIFGVELFFVISGFVIFMTLERMPSLPAFIAARLARLYPAFLASMLATLWLTAEPVRLDQLFANLTMAPLALGQMPYDGSYWSLRFELEFYFLAALCVLVLHWRNPELPCTGWLAAEFLLRAFVGATPRQPLMDLTHTSFAHLFIIGIMLYRVHSGRATRLTVPLLIGAIAMSFYGPHWTFAPISRLAYVAIVASFALLVWLATTRHGRFLSPPPLRFLGRISYPLYLVHQAAGFTLLDRLRGAAVPLTLAVPIAIIAAIMLAWVISTLVEWPAQRWLRNCFADYWRSRAAESNPRVS